MFQVPSQIQGVRTLVDGGLKLDVITQELPPAEKTQVFDLHKKMGWFTFKETEIKKEDLIDLPDIKTEFNEKTPAERLRNCLYIYWQQQGEQGNFNDFYKKKIEEIITKVKEKLDDN